MLIVQVPVGAVVKQLREGVRKNRSQREAGRESRARKAEGEKAVRLEEASIHAPLIGQGMDGRQQECRTRGTADPPGRGVSRLLCFPVRTFKLVSYEMMTLYAHSGSLDTRSNITGSPQQCSQGAPDLCKCEEN